VELLAQPTGNDVDEGAETNRRIRQAGFQQPLELQQRLVVEPDVIELIRAKVGRTEAEIDGLLWETGIVLAAAEAFLFSRRNELTIDDERRCRVVIER